MPQLCSGTNSPAGIKRRILEFPQAQLPPHLALYRRHNEVYRTYREYAQFQSAYSPVGRLYKVVPKASFGILKQAYLAEAILCKSTLYGADRPLPLKHQVSENGLQHK